MKSITRVGIDASKDRLDVYIERERNSRLEFSNDETGVRELIRELGEGEYLIAIEASGRYEALARHALESVGYSVRVQNPRQVRRLAEGLGIHAKTDRIDARVLAKTAELCALNQPRSQGREQLGDLSRLIERLKLERTGHLKRIQAPGLCKVAAKALRQLVKVLDKQIQTLHQEFEKMVEEFGLGQSYKLVQTIPCVGPNLARVAVSELPEDLSNWSIRQISSYAGVAPMDDSSGKRTSPSKLPKHKNVHLKASLYMPALGLTKNHPWAKHIYARQKAKGLTHQQAIVPVMHKLLFHVVAVMKRGSPWQGEPPKKT